MQHLKKGVFVFVLTLCALLFILMSTNRRRKVETDVINAGTFPATQSIVQAPPNTLITPLRNREKLHQQESKEDVERDFITAVLKHGGYILKKEMFRAMVFKVTQKCENIVIWGRPLGVNSVYDGEKKVCFDSEVKPNPDNCIVYSFGVNEEWDFEEAAAAYGCEVYSFDPSAERNTSLYKPHIHFYRIGVFGETMKKKKENKIWDLMKFSDIIKMLGHENRIIDILKMDVEGAEWSAFPEMLKSGSFNQVKQMQVELHLHEVTNLHTLHNVYKYGFSTFSVVHNVRAPASTYLYESALINTNFLQ